MYLDLVMLWNSVLDFLLLLGANRLSGCPPCLGRMAAAAGIGGLYGGISRIPGAWFLRGVLWRGLIFAVMTGVSFGWNRGGFRRGGVFLLLSMALGGLMLAWGHTGLLPLAGAGTALVFVCRVGFRGRPEKTVAVCLVFRGKIVSGTALRDTGNTLRDPVTGEQVLIAGADVAQSLTGLTRQQLASPLETLTAGILPGLRLIPYRAVGQSGAMLLAVRCDRARVGSWQGRCVVAFSPELLGTSGTYSLLAGGTMG